MVTIMLMMIVGLLLVAGIPFIGNVKENIHRIDLMAGDEGED